MPIWKPTIRPFSLLNKGNPDDYLRLPPPELPELPELLRELELLPEEEELLLPDEDDLLLGV